MDPTEIVMRDIQGNSGNVVLQLFRERVCQASEAMRPRFTARPLSEITPIVRPEAQQNLLTR
jgi:hypothetical protein